MFKPLPEFEPQEILNCCYMGKPSKLQTYSPDPECLHDFCSIMLNNWGKSMFLLDDYGSIN